MSANQICHNLQMPMINRMIHVYAGDVRLPVDVPMTRDGTIIHVLAVAGLALPQSLRNVPGRNFMHLHSEFVKAPEALHLIASGPSHGNHVHVAVLHEGYQIFQVELELPADTPVFAILDALAFNQDHQSDRFRVMAYDCPSCPNSAAPDHARNFVLQMNVV